MKRFLISFAALTATLLLSIPLTSCQSGNPGETVFDTDPVPKVPKYRKALFNGRNYKGWTLFIKTDDEFAEPAEQVFTVKDGVMHITGKGFGGCITEKAYKDYHLSMEFRYVGEGYGPRAGKAADGGLLYHCIGEDKAYKGRWNLSFECNIIQGRCADLIIVSDTQKGSSVLRASSYVDPELRWTPENGVLLEMDGKGRVNSRTYEPSWQDSDVQPVVWPEKPYGEWNRIDLICAGDTAEYILNGETVVKLFGLYPSGGRIQLQSECHEIEYRNIYIEPIK